MRAAILNGLHLPLTLAELAEPQPGAGAVLVRVRAAALNHRDAWIRKGQYAKIQLPCVLGSDGAGEVIAVGAGVDAAWIGRRVIIHPCSGWGPDSRAQGKAFLILGMPAQGTLAERIVLPLEMIEPLPEHLSFAEGAALPVGGLTAYRALVTRGELKAGEHVLITGIGGGVATLALILARALGATVSATSSSAAKLEQARGLGASFVANYSESDWDKQLLAQAGRAPSLIVDSAGGDTLNALINLCEPGGRIVLYGATRGLPTGADLRRIFFKQLDVRGATMGTSDEFRALLGLVAREQLRPVIDRVFPLADVNDALARLEQSEQTGKVVIDLG